MARVRLTARGVAALAVGVPVAVAGELLGLTTLTAAGVCAVAAVVAGVVLSVLPGELDTVEVDAGTGSATIGEAVIVVVRLSRRGAGLRVLERVAATGMEAVAGPPAPVADGLRYAFTALRRGEVPIGPVVVTTRDVLGMTRRRQTAPEPPAVRISPIIAELTPLAATREDTDGPRPQHHVTGLDDVGARPLAPGDPLRRIHWRATARRDELMVRQEDSGASPRATVVLDRLGWSPMAAFHGLDRAFERAVEAAASVTVRFGRDGYDVVVVDGAGTPITAVLPAQDAADPAFVGPLLALVTAADDDPAVSDAAYADDGPRALISSEGADDIAPGPRGAVLVRCGERAAPTPHPGWIVVDAPPGRDLTDAWMSGGLR